MLCYLVAFWIMRALSMLREDGPLVVKEATGLWYEIFVKDIVEEACLSRLSGEPSAFAAHTVFPIHSEPQGLYTNRLIMHTSQIFDALAPQASHQSANCSAFCEALHISATMRHLRAFISLSFTTSKSHPLTRT